MTICSSGHDEIVHEGWDCPLCTLMSQYKDKIDDLDSIIYDLKYQIDNLTDIVSEYAPEELV